MWPLVVIAVLGLVTAGFCFGVLKSKAEVGVGYSAGGAFAGALIAWSALGALYLQFNRSSTFVRDLLRENQSLQNKVLRGAPRPNGFDSEVDERSRLVFARPGDWQPGGGLIFDFQSPFEPGTAVDIFPARFRVFTEPIDPEELASEEDTQAAYYRAIESATRQAADGRVSATEIVYVGAEPDGARSLRTTSRTYARATVLRDPNKARPTFSWEYVTEDVFQSYVRQCVADALRSVRAQNKTGVPSTGLDAMSADSRVVDEVSARVITDLESGSFRHEESKGGLIGALEADLSERYGPSNGQPNGGSESARSVEGSANGEEESPHSIDEDADGAGLRSSNGAPSQPAREGADAVTAVQPTAVVWEEILPIVRTTVICYQKNLRQIFYFDFADNPADYVESSESFNQILRSVRFLN
jgi:hypothetical protein